MSAARFEAVPAPLPSGASSPSEKRASRRRHPRQPARGPGRAQSISEIVWQIGILRFGSQRSAEARQAVREGDQAIGQGSASLAGRLVHAGGRAMGLPGPTASGEQAEPLADQHDATAFDSGVPGLDDWLRRRARMNQSSGASRTFVACEDMRVVAYYALSAGCRRDRRCNGPCPPQPARADPGRRPRPSRRRPDAPWPLVAPASSRSPVTPTAACVLRRPIRQMD